MKEFDEVRARARLWFGLIDCLMAMLVASAVTLVILSLFRRS